MLLFSSFKRSIQGNLQAKTLKFVQQYVERLRNARIRKV
ncbi:MAG: hypothetical protein RL155_356, partial [Actinomycetota bacterium]